MRFSFDDDDASWGSANAVEDLIQEMNVETSYDSQQHSKEYIEIDLTGDVELVGKFVETLPPNKAEISFQSVFSPESESSHLEEITALASVSRDSSFDQQGSFHDKEDIVSLMTGELLEPQVPCSIINQPTSQPVLVAQQETDDDSIRRIMSYIHHTEHNRELIYKADAMVQNCMRLHQKGKRQYRNNLNGKIFEGFIKLFGGPRFHEIYQQSQTFDMPAIVPTLAATGPTTVELAIAYGVHMARLDQAYYHGMESPSPSALSHIIHQGRETLNMMNDNERQMFWDFMTKR